MLNPLWLNTFVTLLDVGHFTKTAEKLYMTQPGVSQHIRKLEDACGHALLLRDKKSFQPTEQGRLVYAYAKRCQQQEAALLDNLSFDDPFRGDFTLACSGSLALQIYPLLLDLQCKYPQLIPHVEAAPNQRILNAVQQGEIDLGIVTHLPNPALFDVDVLGHEPLCLIVPANTEFASHAAQSLQDLGLIRHPDAAHYLSLYFTHCGDPELAAMNIDAIPTSGYINQLSQILVPVAKGIGFTVLPKSALNSFSARKQLDVYQAPQAVQETLYLVKKRHRALPARFHTVLDVLKQTIAYSE